MALIRDECKDDATGNMLEALIQNYKDKEYFSSDTDERINQLSVFGYVGTTAMHQTVPSGSGSSLSESSCEAPAVDHWNEPRNCQI